MTRLNREDYFRGIVETVRLRGTCDRGMAGAIIVKNNRILCTGYVGSPSGIPHCDDMGHELIKKHWRDDPDNTSEHCIRTVHAEMNAILQAAKYGIAIDEADMWCYMFPCYDCAKAIINVGIKRVFAEYDYQSSVESRAMFRHVGIDHTIFHAEVLKY